MTQLLIVIGIVYSHLLTHSLTHLLTHCSGINGDAQLVLDDIPWHDWLFKFSSIDKTHIVAVALGPTSDVYDMKKERSVTLDSILQVKTLESLLTTEQVGVISGVPVTDGLVSDMDDLLKPFLRYLKV